MADDFEVNIMTRPDVRSVKETIRHFIKESDLQMNTIRLFSHYSPVKNRRFNWNQGYRIDRLYQTNPHIYVEEIVESTMKIEKKFMDHINESQNKYECDFKKFLSIKSLDPKCIHDIKIIMDQNPGTYLLEYNKVNIIAIHHSRKNAPINSNEIKCTFHIQSNNLNNHLIQVFYHKTAVKLGTCPVAGNNI
ncbi:hypothetical protein RF11_11498 [Thelohanellus kitauei]|uniref:Uncharacterized protein n=1 Tax=Thelohanellus kitauei TaxID=669202 RepID=A0A0C2IFF3_THEKT|nr:hypothetical protein RF11_11498 [Thelohanellus kitauei]